MAFNKSERPDAPARRRGGMRRRKKVCVFCGKENNEIDYKDVNKLKRYVSERGKILPRRITGNLVGALLGLERAIAPVPAVPGELPAHRRLVPSYVPRYGGVQ